jgi:hypothetical protein
MFSAFCAVDMKKLQMNEANIEVKKEEVAPAVVAAAPEVPAIVEAPKAELAELPADKPEEKMADKPEEKMAEPTLADIAGMLSKLIGMLTPKTEDGEKVKDDEEMTYKKEEMSKADEKAVTTLEKAKSDAAGVVAVPAESSQPLARAEILNQFNAEKNPTRRSELLRKLGL